MIAWARRSDIAAVTAWFLLTRALVVIAAFVGAAHPNPGYRLQSLGGPAAPAWLAPFVRWDAAYYIDLARNGYPPAGATPVYHAAFFPLYPMLIRVVEPVFHDTVIAAVVISNVCAWGAAVLLCRLGSRTAALFFLAAPGAGFLLFPYSEALFCLLVTAGLLATMHSRPVLAASFGALASASRPTGLVVAVALAFQVWQQRRQLRLASVSLMAAVLASTGLVAYALFCRDRYGDPLYFAHLQSAWGRQMSLLGPLRAFAEFRFDPDYYLVSLMAIVGAAWMITRAPPILSVASWFLLLVPLSTGSLKSMIRFQSANVPLLAGVGTAMRGRVLVVALGCSLGLMFYETLTYAQGYAHN